MLCDTRPLPELRGHVADRGDLLRNADLTFTIKERFRWWTKEEKEKKERKGARTPLRVTRTRYIALLPSFAHSVVGFVVIRQRVQDRFEPWITLLLS